VAETYDCVPNTQKRRDAVDHAAVVDPAATTALVDRKQRFELRPCLVGQLTATHSDHEPPRIGLTTGED
jgi:hypothetical protein